MIRIDLQFLAGRFHATPWGRHVNEGEPEWPPSPWRLLRALTASWKTTALDLTEDQVTPVLQKLAAPPSFYLPPATVGHTRHYMPQGGNSTLLVHDAFVSVGRDEGAALSFFWPDQSLEPDQASVLDRLLVGVSYFGRAESWCEARRNESDKLTPNSTPASSNRQSGSTTTSLLCPEQTVTVAQLIVETSELQKKGYNRPPGSQWITYQRGQDALDGPEVKRRPVARKKHVAVFLLQNRVLPRRTETLLVADWARMAVNGAYGRMNNKATSANFTGKSNDKIRQDQHKHVFFLPETARTVDRYSQHDRLDRLYIYAPEGFTDKELEVIKALRSFPDLRRQSRERPSEDQDQRAKREAERFHLVPLALLEKGDIAEAFGRSSSWISSTPYLCARHPKKSGKDSAQDQIRRECRQRGLPELLDVVEVEAKGTPWIAYKRRRWNKQAPHDVPRGFRLEFAEPVTGPLSLGASSHFGMGRFEVPSD